jgi:hypothetical protein
MRIDRDEFLRLSVSLALFGGCEGAGQGPLVASPEVPIETAPAAPEAPEESPAPEGPSCPDAPASLAACRRVSPACEGLQDECLTLAEDLRPQVAEAWAECFARVRPSDCRGKALGACMREAIDATCVDPATVARCEETMQACKAAGTPPQYTLEQCTRIASAVVAGGPGEWETVDWERMGPSSAGEACTIEYVLPYQPFGWMWR